MKTGSERWQEIEGDQRKNCKRLRRVRGRNLAAQEPQKSGIPPVFEKQNQTGAREFPVYRMCAAERWEAWGTARSPPEARVLPARPKSAAVPVPPRQPRRHPTCPMAPHRIASSRSRSSSPSSGRSPPAPRRACCGCRAPRPSPL